MKKYLTLSFLLIATFAFAQKGKTVAKETPAATPKVTTPSDKTPKSSPSNGTVILTVDAALSPCGTDPNKQCLQVLGNGADAYESVDDIEGFAYELGYTYTIQVKQILKTPPIGINESLYRYKWIKTISKKEEGVVKTPTYEVPKQPNTPSNGTIYTNENGKKIGKTDVNIESVLDKKWYLRKLKDVDNTNLVTDDNVMYMTISTFSDRLEGFGACNKFAAVVRSDLSTSFNVSKLYYDFANCGYKKIENLFFELLQTANKFEVRNGFLILSNQWNFLLAFTSDPNNKEDISTTYTPQNVYKNDDKTYASSEKQETKTYQEPFTPTPVRESTNTTIETKTVTALDENKQPVTTTNTTVTSNDEDEIQKQIDALEKKKAEKIAAQKKAEEEAKIASDKEAELKKRDELKQQELAAAQAAEQAKVAAAAKAVKDAEKAAKLKELEKLQKELDEIDNGTATSTVSKTVETEKPKLATTTPSSTSKQEIVTNTKATTVITSTASPNQIHDIFSAPEVPITFLGIDFSNAKYFGTLGIVTNTDLASQLKSINYIIPNEYDKYNIAKALKKDNVPLILQLSDNLNKNITESDFVSYSTGGKNITLLNDGMIKTIASKYDLSKYEKGIGLVFIVDNMDKTNEQTTAWITFVDISTNAVIISEKMTGKAGGFGFRSFWAHPFADMIGDIKSKYFKKWKEKYETGNSENKSEITPQKNSDQKIMKEDDAKKNTIEDTKKAELKKQADADAQLQKQLAEKKIKDDAIKQKDIEDKKQAEIELLKKQLAEKEKQLSEKKSVEKVETAKNQQTEKPVASTVKPIENTEEKLSKKELKQKQEEEKEEAKAKALEELNKNLKSTPAVTSTANTTPKTKSKDDDLITVGIFPFKGQYKSYVMELQNQTIQSFAQKSRFTVVDRTNLTTLKSEKELQKTEDFMDGFVVDQGKSFGAKYVVTGELQNIGTIAQQFKRVNTYNNTYYYETQYAAYLNFSVTLLETETGQIKSSNNFNLKTNSAGWAGLFSASAGFYNNEATALSTVMNGALGYIKAWINNVFPVSMKIVKVNEFDKKGNPSKILIKGGADTDLKKGSDLFVIYPEIIEVDGKEYTKPTDVGQIKVLDVDGEFSTCKIKSGGERIQELITQGKSLTLSIKSYK